MLMTRGTIWKKVVIYDRDHSFDISKGLQVCDCKPLMSIHRYYLKWVRACMCLFVCVALSTWNCLASSLFACVITMVVFMLNKYVVLARRPGTCYPLTPLGSVYLFTQLLMKTPLRCVAALRLQTYLLQRVFLQECARSLCVFSCTHIDLSA